MGILEIEDYIFILFGLIILGFTIYSIILKKQKNIKQYKNVCEINIVSCMALFLLCLFSTIGTNLTTTSTFVLAIITLIGLFNIIFLYFRPDRIVKDLEKTDDLKQFISAIKELMKKQDILTEKIQDVKNNVKEIEKEKILNLLIEQEKINKKVDEISQHYGELNKITKDIENNVKEIEKRKFSQVKWNELDEEKQKQFINIAMRKYYLAQLADDRFEISRQQKAIMKESLESGEFFIEDLSEDEQTQIKNSAKNIYENQEFEQFNTRNNFTNNKNVDIKSKKNKIKKAIIIIPCVWVGLMIIGLIIPSFLSLDTSIKFTMLWSIIFWFITTPTICITETVLLWLYFWKFKKKMESVIDIYISKNEK